MFNRFRPSLNQLDSRELPSAVTALAHPDAGSARHGSAVAGTDATPAAPSAEESKRLTSEVLRVQDFVDGLLSVAANAIDQTSQNAVADGASTASGSKTVEFKPPPPPSGVASAPPTGGFTDALPGVTSGEVEFDWSGIVRTDSSGSAAVYRVALKTLTDVTVQDTARPGRRFVMPAGQTFEYRFTWSNRGGAIRYETRGAVNELMVNANDNGTKERLSFNAAYDIAVTKSGIGQDRVDVSFRTVTAIRGQSGRHFVGSEVGVTDTSAGRSLTRSRYLIDGSPVDPGWKADDI